MALTVVVMLAFAATIAALLTRARVAQRTPVPGVAACGEREVELEFNYSAWLLCNFDGSNCKPLSATPVGGGFYRICVPWGMSIKPLDYPWCCKVFRKTGWSPSAIDAGRYYLVVKGGCAGVVEP